MEPRVLLEGPLFGESPLANFTRERFVSSMTSQMTFVRVLVQEVLSAEFTFIGPFASVSLYYFKK